MTILFTNAYRQDSAERWEFLFFRVSLLICVMVTYYVLLHPWRVCADRWLWSSS